MVSNKPEVKVLLEMMRLSNTEAYNHSLSVADLTSRMLSLTKYSEEEKIEIVKGALLHDIGKIFIPLNLTQLPQGLSLQEYNIVKVHASISYEVVRPVFSQTVQNICLYHHERPNGTGYMEKASLYNIPVEALLVQVADEYDALTSNRSYKKQYSSKEAFEIMKSEAAQLMLDDEYIQILETIVSNS